MANTGRYYVDPSQDLTVLLSIYEEMDDITKAITTLAKNAKELKPALTIFSHDDQSLFMRKLNARVDTLKYLEELLNYYKKDITLKRNRFYALREMAAKNPANRLLPLNLKYSTAIKFIQEDCKARRVSVAEAAREYEKRIAEIRENGNDNELITAIDAEIATMNLRDSLFS